MFAAKLAALTFISILYLLIGPVHPKVYSHSEALSLVQAAGISVTSSGGCSNRNNPQCTSLEGVHQEAIDGIITLKRASGCPIIITGATETGHRGVGARSHHNGWKIDIRKRGEDCITRYIKTNFPKISASRWRAASGNIYLNEHNHWDIQYGNNINKRALPAEFEQQQQDSSDEHNHLAKRSTEEQEQDGNDEQWDDFTDATQPQNEMDDDNQFLGNAPNRSSRISRSTNDCLRCICQVESGCRPLSCAYDVNSFSCGFFQIKKDYYIDCYKPGYRRGESVDNAWKRCAADYDCSVKCIQNYVNRFGFKCAGVGPCQRMARLHNGGPSGCAKAATSSYWNRVSSCLP